MVSRYTRFRALLADNAPPRHCDNRSNFNGLASMFPKVGILYGFRITHFLWRVGKPLAKPARLNPESTYAPLAST